MIERWNALSPRARRGWSIAGVVLALIVLMTSLNVLGRAPGGPSLSANSTAPDGLAAWEELLDTNAHPTRQLRADLDRAALDPTTTLIAIGQEFTRKEVTALRRFVDGGGRLIVGDIEAERTLRNFGDTNVSWEPSSASRQRISDTDLSVRADGFGHWRGSKGTPLSETKRSVTAVELSYGDGFVVALADPSIVTNYYLDQSANAWFAVRIAGAAGRPAGFAEHGHGYGTTTGFGALPQRWKTAFWFAAAAAVVGAWSAGKRLGPPDPVLDAPPPERVRYVHAVAATLARTKDRAAAAEPLQARARDLLARRVGLRDLDAPDSLAAAARIAGLAKDDADALGAPLNDDQDLIALARSVSHLQEH